MFAAMAPHELKEGFRKTYAQVKAAWSDALDKGIRKSPNGGEGKNERRNLTRWWSICSTADIFLEQAIEILERSMIQGALARNQRQPVGRQQATGHSSQHPAAQDGGSTSWAARARASARKPVARAGRPPKRKTGAA